MIASRVTYDPDPLRGRARAAGHSRSKRNRAPIACHLSALDTTRLSAIATTVDSAEQILARMSAAARRRPRAAPTEYVAPRSPIEETLADMWAETLHVDHVGVFDDFFELGGSSLQATILVNRLQKAPWSFVRVDRRVRRAHRGWSSPSVSSGNPRHRAGRAHRSGLLLASGEGLFRSRSSGCGFSTSSIPATPSTTSGVPFGFADHCASRRSRVRSTTSLRDTSPCAPRFQRSMVVRSRALPRPTLVRFRSRI